MNRRSVEDLIRLVEDSEIHELTVEGLFTTIRIVKAGARPPEREVVHFAPAPSAAAAPAEEAPAAAPVQNDSGLTPVVSPMVGTFYAAPSPDAKPYVQQGDHVNKGQVVCIVEAMKLMNEIESDVSGTIARVVAENAQPVEYGQVLFLVQAD
jgi:acetyl-CoA carboxylase biotin carboxyl carrier protein